MPGIVVVGAGEDVQGVVSHRHIWLEQGLSGIIVICDCQVILFSIDSPIAMAVLNMLCIFRNIDTLFRDSSNTLHNLLQTPNQSFVIL